MTALEHIVVDNRKDSKPDLSIIIPVYNTQDYVLDTLNSLVSNNTSQYELIIVDDESPDNAQEVITQWLRQHAEVSALLLSKANGGLGAARNSGVKFARGDYLAFMDSDDLCQAGTYAGMIKFMQANHIQIAIARAKTFSNRNYQCGDFNDKAIIDRILRSRPAVVTNAVREPLLLRVEPNACVRIIAKDFFEQALIGFPEKVLFEDLYPHSLAMAKAQRVGLYDDVLLIYRMARLGQITGTKGKSRFDIIKVVQSINEDESIRTLNQEAGAILCNQIAKFVLWCAAALHEDDLAQFFVQYTRNIDQIPSEWWQTSLNKYAENELEQRFCEYSLENKPSHLAALFAKHQAPGMLAEKTAALLDNHENLRRYSSRFKLASESTLKRSVSYLKYNLKNKILK
ncbi:glycosyltransferase family 2 protein [Brackiella oedipodis]|uniref:glycosyltransferase family 2 protein n=1 Tax=Brackiella oedipodis TaxID=124225 RepID=UPI00048A53A9|nr:glycosyltransferase family 2 protein [Brackiella oedipodis]